MGAVGGMGDADAELMAFLSEVDAIEKQTGTSAGAAGPAPVETEPPSRPPPMPAKPPPPALAPSAAPVRPPPPRGPPGSAGVPFVRPPAPVPPTLAAAAVARLQGKGQVVSKPVQVEEIVVEEPPKAEPPKAFPPAASTSAPAARAAELPGTVALPPPMVPPPVAPVIPPPPQAVRPPTDGPMAPKVKPKLLNPGPEPTKAIPCRLFFDGRCEAGAMCPYAHMLDKVTGRAILVPPVGPDGKFIAEVVGKSGKVKKAAVDEETLKKKEVHRRGWYMIAACIGVEVGDVVSCGSVAVVARFPGGCKHLLILSIHQPHNVIQRMARLTHVVWYDPGRLHVVWCGPGRLQGGGGGDVGGPFFGRLAGERPQALRGQPGPRLHGRGLGQGLQHVPQLRQGACGEGQPAYREGQDAGVWVRLVPGPHGRSPCAEGDGRQVHRAPPHLRDAVDVAGPHRRRCLQGEAGQGWAREPGQDGEEAEEEALDGATGHGAGVRGPGAVKDGRGRAGL